MEKEGRSENELQFCVSVLLAFSPAPLPFLHNLAKSSPSFFHSCLSLRPWEILSFLLFYFFLLVFLYPTSSVESKQPDAIANTCNPMETVSPTELPPVVRVQVPLEGLWSVTSRKGAAIIVDGFPVPNEALCFPDQEPHFHFPQYICEALVFELLQLRIDTTFVYVTIH